MTKLNRYTPEKPISVEQQQCLGWARMHLLHVIYGSTCAYTVSRPDTEPMWFPFHPCEFDEAYK